MKIAPETPLLRGLTAVVFWSFGTVQAQQKPTETEPVPIRALLVTGGASHDYASRKEILVEGIRERVARRIEWAVRHEGDGESDVKIPLFQVSEWADGYDIVVHDYCFPRVKDGTYIERILAPHRAGLPAVLVHGTMHSFRTGDDAWFEFCGATSRSHGPAHDFTVEPAPGGDAIIAGMIPWTVPRGELYLIERLYSGSTALTFSRFTGQEGEKQATTWSHLYGPAKARVFASTLGNEIPTLLTPDFLDLLARGFLWALNDLTEERFVRVKPEDSLASLSFSPPKLPLPRPGPSLSSRGRTSALSSATSPLFASGKAVDGDPDTYWESGAPGPSSWQVDLRRDRQVGAVMLTWRDEAPGRYQIEGSRDGLSWQMLLDASGEGRTPVTIGFDPRPFRYFRVSISETAQGFVPGIREFAAYGRMDEMPAAFPDFITINGSPRVNLATVGAVGWESTIRLAPEWIVSGRGTIPGGEEVLQVIPTAAGEAFVLGQKGSERGRTVHLATPRAGGGILVREFLGGLTASTLIAYDGEWLYTLDGLDLVAYRDTNDDGAADDRTRPGKLFFPSDRDSKPLVKCTQFRIGPDGWFYASVSATEEIAGFNSRHKPVILPRHGLVRFRGNGGDLRVHASGETALADFQFGKGGTILVMEAHGRAGDDGREIHPLTPLPGAAWRDLPALAWPPSPDSDPRWRDMDAVHLRDRLYAKRNKEDDFPLIAEIAGLTIVAGDGARLWFSSTAEGGTMLGFLSPAADAPAPFVEWDTIPTKDLFSRLSSPHLAVRTEGVFEILRRKYRPLRDLERLLGSDDADRSIEGIFATLSASGEKEAGRLLIEAAGNSDPARQAPAFRHLGDRPEMRNHPVFGEISRSTVPAVTAGILGAMERTGTGLPALEELVLSLAGHPDTALAATARAFLQTRGAAAVCFRTLDDEAKAEAWPAAFAVLSGIHRPTVVEGIVLRLEQTRSARKRLLGIDALLKLYHDNTADHREWAGTPVIDLYLRASLHDHRVDIAELLRGMTATGVPPPSPSILLDPATRSIPLEAFTVGVLSSSDQPVPGKAIPWLEEIVKSPERDLGLRTRALGLLVAGGAGEDYRRLFDEVVNFTGIPPVGEASSGLLSRWLSRNDHLSRASWLMEQSGDSHSVTAALAWGTILTLAAGEGTPAAERDRIRAHLEAVASGTVIPRTVLEPLLAALPWAGEDEASIILAAARAHGDDRVRELAREMVLERSLQATDRSPQPTAGEMATGALADLLSSARGDLFIGRQLFRQLACDACHNVHGEGPALGPDLAASPGQASLPDMINSILIRGDAITPVEGASVFELAGGRRLHASEAVPQENKIYLRDRVGNPFSLDRSEVKQAWPVSGRVMTCGTAELLSVEEFASLVQFLESLGR